MVMIRYLIIAATLATTSGVCLAQQQTQIIKLEELKQFLRSKEGGIDIVNFWATWCGPCVKELPYFESLSAEDHPGIRVTLVSMDLDLDPNPEKVYSFIKRKGIKSRVWLLDEQDPNSYIDDIDPSWTGALPATLLLDRESGKRMFVGRSLREGELQKLIDELLKR